jgi:cyclic pyranopterin phosphate synthase
LTRWGKVEDVWEGVLAAEEAGLTPVKINAVVVRGYNEQDVIPLASLTRDHPQQVRFIEMMPSLALPSLAMQRSLPPKNAFA